MFRSRKTFAALAAVVAATMATPAIAALTLTLQAAPGYDLGNIHPGDVLHIDAVLGGSAGEYYESSDGYYRSSGNVSVAAPVYGANRKTQDLASNPVLLDFTVTALQSGAAFVTLDYTGTGDNVTTSAAVYQPIATVNFTVLPMPELATWSAMIVGMGLIGGSLRSARRRGAFAPA